MKKSEEKKPMSKKPMGASQRGWNTEQLSTDGPVLCEICGTVHPENREQSYYLSEFLGYQVVDDCCGIVIDRAYQGLGKDFAIALLEEFADNPGDIRFYTLRCALVDAMEEAQKNLVKVSEEVAKVYAAAEALGK